MLLTMRILGAIQLSALEDPELAKVLAERPTQIALDLGAVSAGVQDGVFFCHGMPPLLCARIQTKLNTSTAVLLQQVQRVNDRIASYAGVVMFVLLPGFALALSALFRYRGFSYTEHLVFALHLHTFWFVMATLMIVGAVWLDGLVWLGLVVILVYAALAFRRVYGGPPLRLAVRAALLMVVHTVLVVLIVAVTALVALLV
jgi:hypothetical protein